MGYLPGDCLLAAAFLSYMGPFLSQYRDEVMEKIWQPQVDISIILFYFIFLN
jgi:dynein heavy chain